VSIRRDGFFSVFHTYNPRQSTKKLFFPIATHVVQNKSVDTPRWVFGVFPYVQPPSIHKKTVFSDINTHVEKQKCRYATVEMPSNTPKKLFFHTYISLQSTKKLFSQISTLTWKNKSVDTPRGKSEIRVMRLASAAFLLKLHIMRLAFFRDRSSDENTYNALGLFGHVKSVKALGLFEDDLWYIRDLWF
jgi:hypothetical protein